MRCLALSGGGVRGAYQAGVISHILGTLRRQYDLYCGISVGAINSSFLSMYGAGSEVDAADSLVRIWYDISNEKVWRKWYRGLLGPIPAIWKSSVLDTSPLRSLIHSYFDLNLLRSSGKKLCVGAVGLSTGEYRTFTSDYPDIEKAILASSAFPGFFEPVFMDGQYWIDGGVREVVPLRSAIDMGATEIDVIVTCPDGVVASNVSEFSVASVTHRVIDVMFDEILSSDIKMTKYINDLVLAGGSDKRHVTVRVIRPKIHSSIHSIDFNNGVIRRLIEDGRRDAQQLAW